MRPNLILQMSSFHSWVCETLIGSADPEQVTARLTTAYIAFIHLQLLTVVMPANYGRYADVKSALTLTGVRFSTRNVMMRQRYFQFYPKGELKILSCNSHDLLLQVVVGDPGIPGLPGSVGNHDRVVEYAYVRQEHSHGSIYDPLLQQVPIAKFIEMPFNEPDCTLRSFVFPFTLRGASTTPLLPTVLAFGFCSLNGFFQVHSILHGNHQEDENYARMAAGKSELRIKYI